MFVWVQIPFLAPKNKQPIWVAYFFIQAAGLVYHQPFGAVSPHASACIFLRLDDIQHFVLMICNSYGIDDMHAYGVIWKRDPALFRRKGKSLPSTYLGNDIQVFDLYELFSLRSNMRNEILTLSVLRLICSANLQL